MVSPALPCPAASALQNATRAICLVYRARSVEHFRLNAVEDIYGIFSHAVRQCAQEARCSQKGYTANNEGTRRPSDPSSAMDSTNNVLL